MAEVSGVTKRRSLGILKLCSKLRVLSCIIVVLATAGHILICAVVKIKTC